MNSPLSQRHNSASANKMEANHSLQFVKSNFKSKRSSMNHKLSARASFT